MRELTRGHLVEGDRGGITLRVQVPLLVRSIGQERLQVRRGACPGIGQGNLGQREVEQDEVLLFVGTDLGDAQVVGLDVSMPPPFPLQKSKGVQQVIPPSLQELDAGRAITPQLVRQGLSAGQGLDQYRAVAQRGGAEQLDNARVSQSLERGPFCLESRIGVSTE